MENNTRILGKLIHDKRKEKGYTLSELGELLGITKNAVYRYEKGLIKDIPLEKRIMLSKFLDIPPIYFDFDRSFFLDQQISALSGNNNILKYSFEANRLTNLFLNELHISSSAAPFIEREKYILIDKTTYSIEELDYIRFLLTIFLTKQFTHEDFLKMQTYIKNLHQQIDSTHK